LACAFRSVKAFHSLSRIALLALVVAGSPDEASAQPQPRVTTGDVAGTIGWLSADTHPSGPYNDNNWANTLFGAVSAGWYWTDNLKTEVDFGVGTKARVFSSDRITLEGRTTFVTTDSRFSRRTLGISQQYQFFHNVWFHPHLAAGVNVTWERRTDQIGPVYLYDDVARTSRIVTLQQPGPRTSVTVRPFVAAGYKAYMTRRTFFRNDLRVAFRGGPDETVLRIGFGVDF
jgi:outer membrane protein W